MKLLLYICGLSSLFILSGCDQPSVVQSQMKAEAEIRESFDELKNALTRGDHKAITQHLSPGTMEMFSTARAFGLDPDSIDLNSISQFEVFMGFQARWIVGADELESISVEDLFKEGVLSGMVPIGHFSTVSLADIQIDGATATAYMTTGSSVETNTFLSFVSHDGKWTLEFDKVLLSSEPLFADLRAQQAVGKQKMAILMLERIYQKSAPSLRMFLLEPRLRELANQTPSVIYDAVLEELSAGRQGSAEDLLDVCVSIHTNDQRLAFAQATCSRSRWSKIEARRQFRRILDMNPATLEGNCARYMLDLDERHNVEANMKALRALANDNPSNPFPTWLLAIEGRNFYKLTGKKTYSNEAGKYYRLLLKMFDVGPVLVHQTFANVLSEELDLKEEALKHRYIAVSLEPKSWTYQGLANTLSAMKRYDEANEAYAKLVELDPYDVDYWRNWAGSLSHQGRWDECIEKNKKAIECDPSCFEAYNSWGYALESQEKFEEALEKYEKAISLNPSHTYAYDAMARVSKKMGALGTPPADWPGTKVRESLPPTEVEEYKWHEFVFKKGARLQDIIKIIIENDGKKRGESILRMSIVESNRPENFNICLGHDSVALEDSLHIQVKENIVIKILHYAFKD